MTHPFLLLLLAVMPEVTNAGTRLALLASVRPRYGAPLNIPPRIRHAGQNEQGQQHQKHSPPVHRRKVVKNR